MQGEADSRARDVVLWHPNAHTQFGENLYYFLLAPIPYDRGVLTEIAKGLHKIGIQGFCLYEVFGHYDVLLRTWLNQELAVFFYNYLDKTIGASRNRPLSFSVRRIFHWSTGRRLSTPHDLGLLTPLRVQKVQQEHDPAEIKALRDANIISHVGPISDERFIKFYIVISHIQPTEIVIEEVLVENILKELEEFEKGFSIEACHRTSLYLGDGFGWAAVKGLAPTVSDISSLADRLGRHLKRLNMRTTTFIVSNTEQESDFINTSSLHIRGGPSPIMKQWLPEIFIDPKAAANWQGFEGIALQAYEQFEKQLVEFSDQQFIRDLLIAVLKEDEPSAIKVLFYWFLELEATLRGNVMQFLRGLGFEDPTQVHTHLLQALKIMDWGAVTIGDRLKFYVEATKRRQREIPLAEMPQWERYTALAEHRNNVAHGVYLGGKLLKNAPKVLEEVIQFVPFYAGVRRLIGKTVSTDEKVGASR